MEEIKKHIIGYKINFKTNDKDIFKDCLLVRYHIDEDTYSLSDVEDINSEDVEKVIRSLQSILEQNKKDNK